MISLLERYPYLCGMTSRSGAPCSGRERLAVHAHREQRARMEQVLHAHEIEVAVGAVDADPRRLELRPRELQQLTAQRKPSHSTRPDQHCTHLSRLLWVMRGRRARSATFRRCGLRDQASDGELPRPRVGGGDGIERHHLQVMAIGLVGGEDPLAAVGRSQPRAPGRAPRPRAGEEHGLARIAGGSCLDPWPAIDHRPGGTCQGHARRSRRRERRRAPTRPAPSRMITT